MRAPSLRLVTSVSLLVVASLLLAVWSLQSGAVTLDFAQVFHALTGSAPRNITMVVTEWRLPRVAMAILVGAALGVLRERDDQNVAGRRAGGRGRAARAGHR